MQQNPGRENVPMIGRRRGLALRSLPVPGFMVVLLALLTAASTPLSASPTAMAEAAKLLPGRWQTTTHDKETGVTETLVIEFTADGRYTTQLQSSHFKSPRFNAHGSYSIVDADPSGFTLKIARKLEEPESEKADASEVQRIEVVDDNTLKAADGAIVRRTR